MNVTAPPAFTVLPYQNIHTVFERLVTMLNRYLSVKVRCALNYGAETDFYFYANEQLQPVANYCDNYRPCAECSKCARSALDKLIQRYTE